MIFEILVFFIIFFIPIIAGCGRKKHKQLPPGANTTLIPPCGVMVTDSKEADDSRETTRSENKESVKKEGVVNKPVKRIERKELPNPIASAPPPPQSAPPQSLPQSLPPPKTDETVKKSAEKTRISIKKSMEKPKTDIVTANEIVMEEDSTQKDDELSLEPTQLTNNERTKNEETSMMKTDDKTQEKTEEVRKPHVTIEPETLEFQSEEMEVKTLKITNSTDKKVMFKIKSSDNVAYQVNPVFGVMDPLQSSEIMITHSKSAPKEDKLVVLNSLFTGDQKDLAKSFRTAKPTGEPFTVKMIAK